MKVLTKNKANNSRKLEKSGFCVTAGYSIYIYSTLYTYPKMEPKPMGCTISSR